MSKPKPFDYEKTVEEIVDNIMNEKNDNPRDSTFRFLQKYHPEAQHISLRYPGKFVKSLETETFTINNRSMRMDGAELVNPDDILPYPSTINPKQQTTVITPLKTDSLYEYKLQLTIKYKRTCINVVVTNIGDKDKTVICESHGDAFKVYIRVFNDAEISKRLYSLKLKIKSKKKLYEIETLDFAYVLLFAQEKKAKEYTIEIVALFVEIKNLSIDEQIDIFYVLKKLIRLHFRDDLEKTKELLTMMVKSVHPNAWENMTTLQKALLNVENLNEELTQKENQLLQKDNQLNKKDQEIKKLRKTLNKNNIKVDF